MALWGNETGTKKDFSNKEVGTVDKTSLLDLFTATTNVNADFKADINLDESKKSDTDLDARVYNPVNTFSPIDNRSLRLVLNSSDTSLAKKDTNSPYVRNESNPSVSLPTDFGTTSPAIELSPSLGVDSGIGSIALVGGVVAIAGIFIYSKRGRKK